MPSGGGQVLVNLKAWCARSFKGMQAGKLKEQGGRASSWLSPISPGHPCYQHGRIFTVILDSSRSQIDSQPLQGHSVKLMTWMLGIESIEEQLFEQDWDGELPVDRARQKGCLLPTMAEVCRCRVESYITFVVNLMTVRVGQVILLLQNGCISRCVQGGLLGKRP